MNANPVTFSELLTRLSDQTQPFPAKYLHYFQIWMTIRKVYWKKAWNKLDITRNWLLSMIWMNSVNMIH